MVQDQDQYKLLDRRNGRQENRVSTSKATFFFTNLAPPDITLLATSLYVPTYLTTHREKMRCFMGKTRQFCRNIITAMQRNATAKRTHKAF